MRLLLALALLLAPAPCFARAFLGISTTNAALPALPEGETRAFASALEVVFVAPQGPGESAGIEPGDVVLALDGRSLDPAEGDPAVQWRRIIERMEPGKDVTLTLLRRSLVARGTQDGLPVADARAMIADLPSALSRMPEGSKLALELSRPARMEDVVVRLARHPLDPPAVRRELGFGTDERTLHGALIDIVARENGVAEQERRLAEGLRDIARAVDAARLSAVRGALMAPGALPKTVSGIAAAPPANASDAAALLDVNWRRTPEPLPRPAGFDELVSLVEARLAEASAERDLAFKKVSPEDRAFLAEHAADLHASLAEGPYVHADEDAARAKRIRRMLETAGRVDLRPLLRAAGLLEPFADPAWLAWAAAALRSLPGSGDEWVRRKETPHGEIIIGGTGRNTYRDIDAAFVLDLGGDDVHAHAAGGSRGDARPISVVVDLGGDDAYEATGPFVQGSGLLGVGLLIDRSGDDRYVARNGAQGVSFLGVGELIDHAGDDRYRALHGAQGSAFHGFALLRDEAGDDTYDALSHAQGLGLPRGLGVVLDVSGDDRYFAKGGAPTGYGTYGVFDAWSQGCGLGLRYLASGGMGILADRAGKDEYEAGNFSQGGGYFFGIGLLLDGGPSDDRYLASRYGQGWSAHQAVGAFLEEGGNDLYETRHGVIAGLAWDQSVTWFCDRAGDDTYRASFFSLGASAHDALVIFEDLDGSDRYEGVEVARSGPNDYHGGTSMSAFLDLGEGEDFYEKGAPGKMKFDGEHGFAIDSKGTLDDIVVLPGEEAEPPGGARAGAGTSGDEKAGERPRVRRRLGR